MLLSLSRTTEVVTSTECGEFPAAILISEADLIPLDTLVGSSLYDSVIHLPWWYRTLKSRYPQVNMSKNLKEDADLPPRSKQRTNEAKTFKVEP